MDVFLNINIKLDEARRAAKKKSHLINKKDILQIRRRQHRFLHNINNSELVQHLQTKDRAADKRQQRRNKLEQGSETVRCYNNKY
jgi:hypothetical protein